MKFTKKKEKMWKKKKKSKIAVTKTKKRNCDREEERNKDKMKKKLPRKKNFFFKSTEKGTKMVLKYFETRKRIYIFLNFFFLKP